ncbi:MAG: FAD-dependent oxidoreductase, partial [Armatimonadetes bacterium]|nr:FAD-dependent oxidoreductase [Armatimonadota bacterium]
MASLPASVRSSRVKRRRAARKHSSQNACWESKPAANRHDSSEADRDAGVQRERVPARRRGGEAAASRKPRWGTKISGLGTAGVVVIGAGAVGTSVAYHLAKRGQRVVVVDRGGGCSGTSAATFALISIHSKAEDIAGGESLVRRQSASPLYRGRVIDAKKTHSLQPGLSSEA